MIEHGKMDGPIQVQRISDYHYEIINGHHRWHAAKQLGLDRISIEVIK